MDKLEQYLSKKIDEHNKELEKQKKDKNKKNKKGKGIYIAAIALLLAALTAIGGCVGLKKKKDKNTPTQPTTSTVSPFEDMEPTEDSASLGDLGIEYENPSLEDDKPEYGEVTGDVDKEEIVENEDGIWKDQEAADKSDEIGKEEIDDKNGELEVKPNGDAYEKNDGYEIEKEDGSIIQGENENESELPDGYVHDDNLDKDVVEEDANKFVYVDADYYDIKGELIFKKGEIVSKETLEKIKNDPNFTTTKPVAPEETIPEVKPTEPEETIPETESTEPEYKEEVDALGGVINKDGTYTIYGATYMDKATFEEFLLDENSELNFGYYNGIIYPKTVIDEMFKQNTK